MVWTAAQTTAFFENQAQMAIPHATVVQLANEGISNVEDLADFKEDGLKQLADNLRRPGGRVPDPNPAAGAGATIPTPAFVYGAKSQMRIGVMCNLVRYYKDTGRDITPAMMQWTQVGKNFAEQWKALERKAKDDAPDVPKITKQLPVIRWTEAFVDFLSRVIGVRKIPLSYVIRNEVNVPVNAPALMANQPHSEEHGSVEGELVARGSHANALFREDNEKVYHYLEEATRTTVYAASIKRFQRRKDGQGAWMAMKSQYTGQDKWEAEIKKQEQLIHTRVWKGQSNFSLEMLITQHQNVFM